MVHERSLFPKLKREILTNYMQLNDKGLLNYISPTPSDCDIALRLQNKKMLVSAICT